MHWCMDETLALMAMIPFIGYFFRKIHAWYHAKTEHTCHEKHCDYTHVEHIRSHLVYSRPITWDSISEEDVAERYGQEMVDDARSYLDGRLDWFVNDKAELKVQGQGRTFVHDYECCEHGWREV